MSKQRFLGGLLGADPVRAGSFTDTALTGTVADAETFFVNGETGDFTITGNDIAHNTASVSNVIYGDTTGYTGKYYFEVSLDAGFARAGFLKSSVTDTNVFLGNNAGAFAVQANGVNYNLLEEGTTTSVGTGTLDGGQSHAVFGLAVDFDNDEVTVCWTDVLIDGTRYWVDGSYNTSTSFPASATITTAGVTDRIAVGHFTNVTYPEAYFNFGDDPTFGGNLPGTPTADSSSWYRDPPTGYDGKLGITVGPTDRTSSNVGILSLDEAGPEAVTATISTPATLNLDNTIGTETNPYEVDGIDASLDGAYFSSIGVTSGKHYWEIDYDAWGTGSPFYSLMAGVYRGATTPTAGGNWVNNGPYYGIYLQNQNYTNSVANGALQSPATSAPFPTLSGGTFGILLDADNHTITVYVDGTVSADVNGMSTGGSGTETYYATFGSGGGTAWTHKVNFGQRPFAYSVPSGAAAGFLDSSTETRELTQLNWGGIRGRDVLTDTTAIAIDHSLSLDAT